MSIGLARILVTGGSGFVGTHLCTTLRRSFPDARIVAPRIEMRDPRAVEEAFRQIVPDACVHLAAISTVRAAQADEARAWDVNLHGSLRVARAIVSHAPHCVLLFASTSEAYGETFRDGVPLGESAPLAPLTLYGATKAAADLALGSMVGQGLRVIRVRAFNHTGAGQRPDFVVPAFARNICRMQAGMQPAVMTVGNLEARRDFLDVADVAEGYAACLRLRDRLAPGSVFNLGSGQPRRIGDILRQMLAMAGVNARIDVDPTLLRPTDLPVTHSDSAKAARALGWRPRIAWDDTLRTVLADWRQRVRDEVAARDA